MPCLEVHQLLADIQVVLKCFPNPAIAQHIIQRFTRTMAEDAGRLILKLISINRLSGVQSVLHIFVNTPSVVNARPRG
jgi:hypothetical protein